MTLLGFPHIASASDFEINDGSVSYNTNINKEEVWNINSGGTESPRII